jgi:hypothetical protein
MSAPPDFLLTLACGLGAELEYRFPQCSVSVMSIAYPTISLGLRGWQWRGKVIVSADGFKVCWPRDDLSPELVMTYEMVPLDVPGSVERVFDLFWQSIQRYQQYNQPTQQTNERDHGW